MKYIPLILMLLAGTIVRGQSCNGGLGDPMVNITFGAGPNFGPPLSAGVTNMQYIANQCPNDGQYTIANSTSSCFSNSWLNITQDHTGNANGYFMLINASYQPSDFFVQDVSGLCEGTSYQFAAWILNLAANPGQILPNITFSIETTTGTVLQQFKTGDIAQANPARWNQYAFYFTTPTGVSTVRLRMTNNAPGGIGNDLAIDDITFRPSGPAITLAIAGQSTDKATICEGGILPQTLTSTVDNCYASTIYQWQLSTDNGTTWTDIAGANNQTYSALPTVPGTYLYRLTATQSGNQGISSCKVNSEPVDLIVLPIPSPAVLISDSSNTVCDQAQVSFTAAPTDGGPGPNYIWKVNGQPAASGSAVFNISQLNTGDKVTCEMISNAACVVNPYAISNELDMTVIPLVYPNLLISASTTTICSDSTITFSALSFNQGSNPQYQWLDNGLPVGPNAPQYIAAGLRNGDQVSLLMQGSLLCTVPVTSTPIGVVVHESPSITLNPDTVIAPGTGFRLQPLITGPVNSYEWTPSDGLNDPSIADPMAYPVVTTTYTLQVSTADNCPAIASEKVGVFYGLKMPTAFSPNGDGQNDLFRVPPKIPVQVLHLSLYNRWGQLVYAGAGNNAAWDGRLNGQAQPAGGYVWMLEYQDPVLHKNIMQKGEVILIR